MLIGHWPLDEDSGDAQDYSGNENKGTVNGATQGAPGILGTTAYDFDGTDDYVNFGVPTILDGESEFSVAWWSKSNDASNNDTLISSAEFSGTNSGFEAQVLNQSFRWYHYDSSGNISDFSSSIAVQDNTWYHVAVVSDGSNLYMYVDGVRDNSTTSRTMSNTTDRDLEFGRNTDDGILHGGSLTNVRIYDRALSPNEVQYLYEVSERGQYLSDDKTL